MDKEGKVSKVLTPREVALSGGSEIGVQEGDTAIVYRVYDVPDPDQVAESLGSARLTLVKLRVFQVGERFSVGRTVDSVRRDPFPEGLGQSLFQSRRPVKVTDDPGEQEHGVVFIQSGDLVEYHSSDADGLE